MQVIFNVVIKVTGVGWRVHNAGVKCRHKYPRSFLVTMQTAKCRGVLCYPVLGGEGRRPEESSCL